MCKKCKDILVILLFVDEIDFYVSCVWIQIKCYCYIFDQFKGNLQHLIMLYIDKAQIIGGLIQKTSVKLCNVLLSKRLTFHFTLMASDTTFQNAIKWSEQSNTKQLLPTTTASSSKMNHHWSPTSSLIDILITRIRIVSMGPKHLLLHVCIKLLWVDDVLTLSLYLQFRLRRLFFFSEFL